MRSLPPPTYEVRKKPEDEGRVARCRQAACNEMESRTARLEMRLIDASAQTASGVQY